LHVLAIRGGPARGERAPRDRVVIGRFLPGRFREVVERVGGGEAPRIDGVQRRGAAVHRVRESVERRAPAPCEIGTRRLGAEVGPTEAEVLDGGRPAAANARLVDRAATHEKSKSAHCLPNGPDYISCYGPSA